MIDNVSRDNVSRDNVRRGGLPRSVGNLPEGLSRARLVGTMLVGRLGVLV